MQVRTTHHSSNRSPAAALRGLRAGLRRVVRDQRGAAAIEFAILLPVLCAILLGMIDYGYFFYLNSAIVNAAREGARAGVVERYEADAEAQGLAVARTYLTRANIRLDTGVNSATVTSEYTAPNLVVTVDIDYTPVTGFLPTAAMPDHATHVSSMRVEGLL